MPVSLTYCATCEDEIVRDGVNLNGTVLCGLCAMEAERDAELCICSDPTEGHEPRCPAPRG